MSYQVLARKWRPQTFAEVVGQAHVLSGLQHALDSGRLHHAYLFTGTRGVGKTTIARILAKCLSCQHGPTSIPCGQCDACVEIAKGRYVDLLEIDAASRTKVEDTRELLDNVQYAPAKGRFKIYLIDEVHMLSTHSFNALLKTLEEPPEHVKFLLCTTDPQKLPVTVLSRCLQLLLKHLLPTQIAQHLQEVLAAENIDFEAEAVRILAVKANGSLRDALSLLDQAIALGAGHVRQAAVQQMLGVTDQQYLLRLLQSLASGNFSTVMTDLENTLSQGVAPENLLADLARLIIAIAHQQVEPAWSSVQFSAEVLTPFVQQLPAEQLQVWYEILILSRQNLTLAPDPQTGLEMAFLRLMAFRPSAEPLGKAIKIPEAPTRVTQQHKTTPIAAKLKPKSNEPSMLSRASDYAIADLQEVSAPAASECPTADASTPKISPVAKVSLSPLDWDGLVAALPLPGMAKQLARYCTVLRFESGCLTLNIAESHAGLVNDRLKVTMLSALKEICPGIVRLEVVVSASEKALEQSPANQAVKIAEQQQQRIEAQMLEDPTVSYLRENFAVEVVPGSIKAR